MISQNFKKALTFLVNSTSKYCLNPYKINRETSRLTFIKKSSLKIWRFFLSNFFLTNIYIIGQISFFHQEEILSNPFLTYFVLAHFAFGLCAKDFVLCFDKIPDLFQKILDLDENEEKN